MKKQTQYIALSALTLLASSAQAASWQICELQVKVHQHLKLDQKIDAIVMSATGKPGVECPQKDSHIIFTPEAADYQSDLPKKRWPKVGATARLRYQYLDGVCKERGPCRIKHYPFLN